MNGLSVCERNIFLVRSFMPRSSFVRPSCGNFGMYSWTVSGLHSLLAQLATLRPLYSFIHLEPFKGSCWSIGLPLDFEFFVPQVRKGRPKHTAVRKGRPTHTAVRKGRLKIRAVRKSSFSYRCEKRSLGG